MNGIGKTKLLFSGTPVRTGDGGFIVTVNGKELDPHLDIWNHSPDGFSWGFSGSGPSQLACAILYHFALYTKIENPTDFVDGLSYKFREHFIAKIPMNSPWQITLENILKWGETGNRMTVVDGIPYRFE